jgi:outer membrane protein insertion porin family
MRLNQEAGAPLGFTGFWRFSAIAILMFLLSYGANAQRAPLLKTIVIAGNESIPTKEIIAWMNLPNGSPLHDTTMSYVVSQIRNGYTRRGFPFASIDSTSLRDSDGNDGYELFVVVQEGKQTIVEEIVIEGNETVPSNELLRGLELRTGSAFLPNALERDIESILQVYERRGYPFASVKVKDLRFAEREVDVLTSITLSVSEEAQLLIQEVRVEGNNSTKEAVVRREARLGEGIPYTPLLTERIKRRLDRLQIFSRVSLPEPYVTKESRGGLLIKVIEGNPNRFDGIVGYAPGRTQNEKGNVTGLVEVQLRNLFGTGRRLATRWSREDRLTQEIAIRYHEPWIAFLPVNGEFGFFQRKQDSSFTRQALDLKADLMLTDQFSFGLSFHRSTVIPEERARPFMFESRTTSIGGFLSYDTRDDAVTPTSGAFYFTEYQMGRKTSGTRSDETQRMTLDLEYYVAPVRRQVVVGSLHGREFKSGSLEIADLYRLGGTSTLRGYRENQFLGSQVAWVSLEYRVLTGGRSFAAAFVDYARMSNPERLTVGLLRSEQEKFGYGVGLRVDTQLGLLGVSLALGEGDTFSSAKLHFRVINEF